MLNPKSLQVGKRYVIQVISIARPVVAICVGHDNFGAGIVNVLNKGFLHETKLTCDDYIPEEEYDETKHGPVCC